MIDPLHDLIGTERFFAHRGEEFTHLLTVQIKQVNFFRRLGCARRPLGREWVKMNIRQGRLDGSGIGRTARMR